MQKKDYSDSDLSDSSYYSNYELSDDDLMVVDDDSSNSSNSVDSNFSIQSEDQVDDQGPKYTYDKLLDDRVPSFRRRYKARAILMNLDTSIAPKVPIYQRNFKMGKLIN